MMKIVVDAGYRGHVGIEYGPEGDELEGDQEAPAGARSRPRDG